MPDGEKKGVGKKIQEKIIGILDDRTGRHFGLHSFAAGQSLVGSRFSTCTVRCCHANLNSPALSVKSVVYPPLQKEERRRAVKMFSSFVRTIEGEERKKEFSVSRRVQLLISFFRPSAPLFRLESQEEEEEEEEEADPSLDILFFRISLPFSSSFRPTAGDG